jgi:hypothetical protein
MNDTGHRCATPSLAGTEHPHTARQCLEPPQPQTGCRRGSGALSLPRLADITDQGCGPLGRMFIMAPVGKKRPQRPRRAFTPEFKAEIVELCQRGVHALDG